MKSQKIGLKICLLLVNVICYSAGSSWPYHDALSGFMHGIDS